MTEGQLSHIQNEYLRNALDAQAAVDTCRAHLRLLGLQLLSIGQAAIDHPEEINPLPEPISLYDYRREIAALRDGERIVKMCAELRTLIQKAQAAENMQASFKNGPFFSRDSAAS
jgi:hypothetical protein